MKRKVLKASINKILTDGEVFGKEIYLAQEDDGNKFYEITKKEYERLQAEEMERAGNA